jgi:hypothetical protein
VTGGDAGGWQYSDDGIHWTAATVEPSNAGATFIVYDSYNDVFIAAGNNSECIARSADGGVTWAEIVEEANGHGFSCLAVSDDGYALVTQEDRGAYGSTNGFLSASASWYAPFFATALGYGKGVFVAYMRNYTNMIAYGSNPTDARDWVTMKIGTQDITVIEFAPLCGRFIAVGDNGAIWTSLRG